MATPLDVLNICIKAATTIKTLADDASFLSQPCKQLSKLIHNFMLPLKKLKKEQHDSEISDDLGEFIDSLYDTIKKMRTIS